MLNRYVHNRSDKLITRIVYKISIEVEGFKKFAIVKGLSLLKSEQKEFGPN